MDNKLPKDKTRSILVTPRARSLEMSRTVTDTGNVFQGSLSCTIVQTDLRSPEEIVAWLMGAIIHGAEIIAKEDS